MSEIVLGDDHDAAGFLVEAMYDAGPPDAADARQCIAAMVDQRIDQGTGPIAISGMDDKAGGFIDDDEVDVLVEDVECDIFPLGSRIFRRGNLDCNAKTLAQLVFGLADWFTVNADLASADERLDAIARKIWRQLRRKPGVQSLAA